MKYGTAYKNLTDIIVLLGAVMAVVSVLLAFLAFEGPYTTKDDITGEELTVESVFDEPEVKVNMKLCIVFVITAIIGFMARKWLMVSMAASVCSVIVSMSCFLEGTLEQVAFAYVIFAVIGLAGNIIHSVLTNEERKESFKEMVREKRRESLAEKGMLRKK